MTRRDAAHRSEGYLDFESPAKTLARSTDPETSKAAAVETVEILPKTERLFLRGLGSDRLTAREAAERAHKICDEHEVDTYRKRADRLVKKKLVRECDPRPCSFTGRNVTTYERVTP